MAKPSPTLPENDLWSVPRPTGTGMTTNAETERHTHFFCMCLYTEFALAFRFSLNLKTLTQYIAPKLRVHVPPYIHTYGPSYYEVEANCPYIHVPHPRSGGPSSYVRKDVPA